MTTRQDGPAAHSPERSVTTAAESARVEVVVDRDPDRAVEVHVFLDEVPVVAELTEVDPGRGWARSQWRELARDHAGRASPAAAAQILEAFEKGEASVFITDD